LQIFNGFFENFLKVADILKNPLVVDPQTGPDLTHFSDCLALLNKIMDEMSSLPGFFGYSVFQVFDELLPLPRELVSVLAKGSKII
jgi:hypothetical protein